MMRIVSLTTVWLFLAGCFVFDKTFDTQSRATITFQIVVNSPSYGGTYVWNAVDAAYETTVGGTRYYVSMDLTGAWCLATAPNQTYAMAVCYTPSPQFRALPVTNGSLWIPSNVLTSVDVSAGGISPQLKPPDSTVSVGDTLHVAFVSTLPGATAKYQWQGSNNSGITSTMILGTGSTYHILDATYPWIRVTITPTDGAGNVIGPAATSPPVRLSP